MTLDEAAEWGMSLIVNCTSVGLHPNYDVWFVAREKPKNQASRKDDIRRNLENEIKTEEETDYTQ